MWWEPEILLGGQLYLSQMRNTRGHAVHSKSDNLNQDQFS